MVKFTVLGSFHCLLFICLFAYLTILTTLYCCQQMQGVAYEMCTAVNLLIPESDQHLISPFNVITDSNIKLWENKGNVKELKNFLIIKQILPASTLGIVQRTVWRICVLMLGCQGKSCNQFYIFRVLLEHVIAVSASA